MYSLYLNIILSLTWSVQHSASLELAGPDYLMLNGGCPDTGGRCHELMENHSEYFQKFKDTCTRRTVLDNCGCSRVCPQLPNQPCGGPFYMYGMCVDKYATEKGVTTNYYCTLSNRTRYNNPYGAVENLIGTCLRKCCYTCSASCHHNYANFAMIAHTVACVCLLQGFTL